MMQLPTLLTVYCIYCPHTEVACDFVSVHRQMEAHYEARHRQLIDAITGSVSA